jgi:hypothetical protein
LPLASHPEQIISSIQTLGNPVNCREVERNDVAVATQLYAGPESKLSLFGGGLNLFVEGSAGKQAQRDTPWFDPAMPVSVRHVFLGGQKTVTGNLPLNAIIPTEDWILKLQFEKCQYSWLCHGDCRKLYASLGAKYPSFADVILPQGVASQKRHRSAHNPYSQVVPMVDSL